MLAERRSRCHSLPLLSPTFRSHQLWTPLYLERLTVNQKNYHNYLRSPRANSNPAHTLPNVRIKKYGDNGFHLQKGIPVEQKYDVTQISRSTIRPWDQLGPRPLTSSQILSKESHLPFPSQHPYTSHISQFAMFPDPSITEQQHNNSKGFHNDDGNGDNACHNDQDANDHKKVHVSVQTDCSYFEQDPCSIPLYLAKEKAPANVIKSKAFSSGMRIECISSDHLKNCGSNLRPGIYRWDVSRSLPKKLQMSMTYPAPSSMYAPRGHPMANSKSLLNPSTFKELNSVNTRVTTSTAYNDHFQTRNSRLVFKRDQNMISSLNDSRGKYARIPQFCSISGSSKGNRSQGKLYHQQQCTMIPQTSTGQASDIQTVNVCNQSTQTDDYITDDSETFADSQILEPENCTVQQPLADTRIQDVLINSPTMSGYAESYLRPSTTGSYCSTDQDGLDQYTCSYNKTEAFRQFHNQYPSHTPDLRQYSVSSGRRHIINGYHAYYWH